MKICHINLAKGFRGGERQTILLIRAMAEYDCRQILMARKNSPMWAQLSDVENLEMMPVSKPYVKYLPRGVQADIVHAHEAKAAQWAFLNFWRRRSPYLITRRVLNSLSNHLFTRAVYRHAMSVVAISSAVREMLASHLDIESVPVVPDMYAELSINEEVLTELQKRYAGKFIIGHLGALTNKDKGQAYLIEAARRLQTEHPNIHFLLLGEGRDREILQAQAAGLTNLEFLGHQQDVGTYLNLFDVFAYPSLVEGLGSSLLDAMRMGVPIVASNVGGIPDLIQHEKNGLLVPPANSDAIVEQILRLYKNAELAEQLVAAGRQDVKQYSSTVISQDYYDLYQSIISPASR